MGAELLTQIYLSTIYVVALVAFLYLHLILRRTYFLLWAGAWSCVLLRSLLRIHVIENSMDGATEAEVFIFEAIGNLVLYLGLLSSAAGVYLFFRRKVPEHIIYVVGLGGVVLGAMPLALVDGRLFLKALLAGVLVGGATIANGLLFFLIHKGPKSISVTLTGALLILGGTYRILLPFLSPVYYLPEVSGYGDSLLLPIFEVFITLLVLCLSVVIALEQVRGDLIDSERRFRHFFEGASDPIFLVDPEDGRIHNVNPRCSDLLGYEQSQLLTMRIQDLAAPEQGTSPAGLLSKLRYKGTGPDVVQTHHRHRDGRLIPISLTRAPIRVDGRDMLIVHTRDISDLRAQERALASRISQLQAVQRIATVLTRTLSVQDIGPVLFESLQRLLDLDFFAVDRLAGTPENPIPLPISAMKVVNGVMTRMPTTGETGLRHAGGGLTLEELQPLIEDRHARLVRRTQEEADIASDYPGACRTLIVLPMIAGDEVIGLLSLGSSQPHAFDGGQIDLLQHTASIAAIALRNAMLYETQQAQTLRQKTIADLGPRLITEHDSVQVAAVVAEALREFLDLQGVEIWLCSEDPHVSHLTLQYPVREANPIALAGGAEAQTIDMNAIRACFAAGREFVINNCSKSPLIPRSWREELGLLSCLAAPILVGQRAIGVIRLDCTTRYNRFQDEDVEFVRLVTQIAAAALESSRLFQRVQASEQRFSQLIQASSIGIAILRDDRLEFANATFQDMLDLADLPITALSIFEMVPEENEAAWQRMLELAAKGREGHIEGWMQRPDGNRIWAEVSAGLINYGGVRAIQLLVEDVTEKRAAEAQRASDLRVRSIGTLTAGIGQDFQELFSAMLGHIGYLKMQIGSPFGSSGMDTEPLESSILAVEGAIMRALDFTRQLMSFAETSEGGVAILDINGVVMSASKLYENLPSERPRMKFALAPDTPRLRGSEDQLRQALLNLMVALGERAGENNTLLVESGGEILDEERAMALGELNPGLYACISFSERRGVIDESLAELLLSSTGSSLGRGSLGMSVMLSTIRNHQGAIEVRGGTATRIVLLLPADQSMPLSSGQRLLSGEGSSIAAAGG
ncbi:MAG: PAS domain S-box protein [Sumerlaeia bacterium]